MSAPPLITTAAGDIAGFDDSMRLLRDAGVPVAPYVVVGEGDALPDVSGLGGRLVVKLADVPHRTELGAVALDVAPADLAATVARLRDIARAEGLPRAVAVQRMVTGHGEAFGGLQCRTELGPVLLLGAGGVLVEVAGRIGGRLLPLDADAAAALVNEVAGPDVFARLRGQRPWPVAPLVDLVVALDALWRRHGSWLASVDVNPLIVTDTASSPSTPSSSPADATRRAGSKGARLSPPATCRSQVRSTPDGTSARNESVVTIDFRDCLPSHRRCDMKAVFFEAHGGPEVLQYGDVPDPVAEAGQVVVDVHAASVNGADWRVRQGAYRPGTYRVAPELPHILGRDFSGVVSAVGADTDLAIGDPVFGVCDNAGGVLLEGAYAERIAMRAAILARKPDALAHVEAAAVALIGLTAVVSIEDTLQLRAGETILIQGGAGGVGGFAVQLAKHLGARVITTASAANYDYVRQLGADEIIDYHEVDFAEVVSDCDAVFDTVGLDVIERCYTVVKPGGRVASIAVGFELPPTSRDDIVRLRPSILRDRSHLEHIVDLVESGAVALPEITVYPLRDAASAHRVSEGRHLRGKLVLAVR